MKEGPPINTFADNNNVAGRTVLVTGATSGIGMATAARLAGAGATVIIHGPATSATSEARDVVRGMHPGADLHVAVADLSSQAAVRGLAADIQDRFEVLDVLVNNAAAVFDHWSADGDGIELTFAVNHLAPYLLTRLLLPNVERSGQGRIVIVGSEAHRRVVWDPDGLQRSAPYDRFDAYARSKLANLLFNAELARRLSGSEVTTNAAHPGTVQTRLFRPRNIAERIAMPVLNLKAVSPRVGADTFVWLASSLAMTGRSGGYYYRRERIKPSAQVGDEHNGFELWKVSADLTGLPVEP